MVPPLTRAAKKAACIAHSSAEQNAMGLTVSYGCINVGKPAAAGVSNEHYRSSTQFAAPPGGECY